VAHAFALRSRKPSAPFAWLHTAANASWHGAFRALITLRTPLNCANILVAASFRLRVLLTTVYSIAVRSSPSPAGCARYTDLLCGPALAFVTSRRAPLRMPHAPYARNTRAANACQDGRILHHRMFFRCEHTSSLNAALPTPHPFRCHTRSFNLAGADCDTRHARRRRVRATLLRATGKSLLARLFDGSAAFALPRGGIGAARWLATAGTASAPLARLHFTPAPPTRCSTPRCHAPHDVCNTDTRRATT